jgi:hypothetical protein
LRDGMKAAWVLLSLRFSRELAVAASSGH